MCNYICYAVSDVKTSANHAFDQIWQEATENYLQSTLPVSAVRNWNKAAGHEICFWLYDHQTIRFPAEAKNQHSLQRVKTVLGAYSTSSLADTGRFFPGVKSAQSTFKVKYECRYAVLPHILPCCAQETDLKL